MWSGLFEEAVTEADTFEVWLSLRVHMYVYRCCLLCTQIWSGLFKEAVTKADIFGVCMNMRLSLCVHVCLCVGQTP